MLAPASDRALRGRSLALKALQRGRIFAFAGPKGGLKPQSPAAADLGFFVGLQGTEKDYVLVQPVNDGGLSEAASERRDALLAWGYGAGEGLPQVVDLDKAHELGSSGAAWEPYCWSEDVAEELQSTASCPQMQLLHGKTWAVQRAAQWRQDFAEELRIRSVHGRGGLAVDAGVICSNEEEALKAINDIGPRDAFIKAELGWAGQSNRITRYAETQEQRQHFLSWLRARLQDGDVLVEPEYQRVLDFSVQLDVSDVSDEISIFSKNIFHTNDRGHFVSTELSPDVWVNSWAQALDVDASAAEEFADWIAWSIAQCVGRALQRAGYRGPCGVDGFLCRAEPEGRLLLQPISDVNPRQTMTRLAMHVAGRCPQEWLPRQLRMLPRHKAEELERSCGTGALSPELAERFGLAAGLHSIPLTPLGHRNRRQRGLAVVLLAEQRSSPKCDRNHGMASELQRFAERILFEGSLEAKLKPPERELYGRLQSATSQEDSLIDVAWPERNQEIELCKGLKGGSDQLPKMSRIIASQEAKIQCLQKFANHELQAIEMFAWALLRFPEAPGGLKLGLLRTLEEEQSHCSLYLQRAKAIAAASNADHDVLAANPLGPAPLSGYLWSCLEGVRRAEEPLLAFLCGVGLTFEAANLDHSLRYRDIFLQAGDSETAAILQRVHDEEVHHVQLASVWLRRLAGASEDLELYQRYAVPPAFVLYKARGKGFLGEVGRRKAGLSEEMIKAVKTARSERKAR